MYSTKEIATFLELKDRAVRYYIEQGYLKAKMVDGCYQIGVKEFTEFKENYFYSKRHENKASGKTLNICDFNIMLDFIAIVKNGASVDELIKKYSDLSFSIPSLEHYEIFKRNVKIRERASETTQKELALEFNLSEPTIQKIISKSEYMGANE